MSDEVRERLYAAYSTGHAGRADPASERRLFLRDIAPHLPSDRSAKVVDLGCGQGQLVRQVVSHGYASATGIDISPEQIALAHAAGITQVRLGDFREVFNHDSRLDAVTATDFFEHLTKEEILRALDVVYASLTTGGVLILRVPNLVSPFGGNYRYGDLTHETSFTARSLRQLGAAARFTSTEVFPCVPPAHGVKSTARAAVWKCVSGAMKLALVAETGVARGHLVTQNVVAVMRKV